MFSAQSDEVTTHALVRLAMVYLSPGTNIFPRAIAGEVLQRVGSAGEYGGVEDGISPFLIGVAIQRLVSNYTDGDEWKIEFLKGLFFNPNVTITATMNVCVTPEDRLLA